MNEAKAPSPHTQDTFNFRAPRHWEYVDLEPEHALDSAIKRESEQYAETRVREVQAKLDQFKKLAPEMDRMYPLFAGSYFIPSVLAIATAFA